MKFKALILATAAIALVAAKNKPAVPAGPIAISAKDKATGAKAHPQLLQEFGGAYEGPQAAYVTKVGQKIVGYSNVAKAPSEFTVTLLNSPVNNAFAVPGGYIYVTRQLMALMNNEAELASVLGHEGGHIEGRHAQKRQSKATLGGLGAIAATVLGGVLAGSDGAKLGQQVGGSLATRYVMGYSRAQEFEADDFGVTYLAKAGYDPMAASSMLASLAAQTSLETRMAGQGESNMPKWAMSHPDPASRVQRAATKAQATKATGKALNQEAFLNALDGVLYDDDPKQGVVEGQTFKHPDLKLSFTAPSGFGLNNGSDAVSISGSAAKGQFSGGPYSGDMSAYIAAVFKAVGGQTPLTPGAISTSDVNGIKTSMSSTDATNSQGQQLTISVVAYEMSPTSAFHFVTLRGAGTADPLTTMYKSMKRLTAAEAAAIKPRKIDVVTVKSGDTIASLAAKMAYSDNQVERFQVLNALKPGEALKSGRKVKLVVY